MSAIKAYIIQNPTTGQAFTVKATSMTAAVREAALCLAEAKTTKAHHLHWTGAFQVITPGHRHYHWHGTGHVDLQHDTESTTAVAFQRGCPLCEQLADSERRRSYAARSYTDITPQRLLRSGKQSLRKGYPQP